MEQTDPDSRVVAQGNGSHPRPLTQKQALFVSYYVGECYGNATEAAARAGYGDPSSDRNYLATMGAKLVRNGEIASRIRAHVQSVVGDNIAVLEQLWMVASAPMNQYMVVTKPATYDMDGNKLDDMHVRLDYTSKVRALELIMRYNRMLEDKAPVEVNVKALIGIDVSRI